MFHPRICCIRKWGNALYHLSIPSSVGLDFNSWDAWLVPFKSDFYKDVFVIINVMRHQISHFSGEYILPFEIAVSLNLEHNTWQTLVTHSLATPFRSIWCIFPHH
jgi:hypothetical protein